MAELRPNLTDVDPVWNRIRKEAQDAVRNEPLIAGLVHSSLLHHATLERAMAYRISMKLASAEMSEQLLREICDEAFDSEPMLGQAVRADLAAIFERDPACHRLLQPVLYFKGFHALQVYRVANWLWRHQRRSLALFLQSRASEIFAVDIHPAAEIAGGIMLDHATGLVIGETAVIGENVSLLHSVTLGGTGAQAGDRHPKIRCGVLIAAGAKVLGNIEVGEGAKIGAGSLVLDSVLPHTTVVGVPARVVGVPGEAEPSRTMDQRINLGCG